MKIVRTIAAGFKARPILGSLLIFAVTVGSAAAFLAVKVKENRVARTTTCVAAGCFRVVSGERVWIVDQVYERNRRLAEAKIFRETSNWFDHLVWSIDEWLLQREAERSKRMPAAERQRFGERRQRLFDRIEARRNARRASMAAIIARQSLTNVP